MQSQRELERRPAPEAQRIDAQRESFGELIGDLATNSAALVRDEIALAKQEMSEKLISFRAGVITIAVSSVILLVGTLTLVAAAVIGLGHLIGPGWSALLIGGVFVLVGGITAMVGLGQLRRTSLKPEQTIETLQEDKEWLKELT